MIRIRKAEDRGHFNHGWLDTYHTFSFGDYHDPEHMGFRSLRVMNEDRVEPGKRFGTHPHRDMELVTYVLEGALEHEDSMGHARRGNDVHDDKTLQDRFGDATLLLADRSEGCRAFLCEKRFPNRELSARTKAERWPNTNRESLRAGVGPSRRG